MSWRSFSAVQVRDRVVAMLDIPSGLHSSGVTLPRPLSVPFQGKHHCVRRNSNEAGPPTSLLPCSNRSEGRLEQPLQSGSLRPDISNPLSATSEPGGGGDYPNGLHRG
jgi:hypothetical protein